MTCFGRVHGSSTDTDRKTRNLSCWKTRPMSLPALPCGYSNFMLLPKRPHCVFQSDQSALFSLFFPCFPLLLKFCYMWKVIVLCRTLYKPHHGHRGRMPLWRFTVVCRTVACVSAPVTLTMMHPVEALFCVKEEDSPLLFLCKQWTLFY